MNDVSIQLKECCDKTLKNSAYNVTTINLVKDVLVNPLELTCDNIKCGKIIYFSLLPFDFKLSGSHFPNESLNVVVATINLNSVP